MARDPRRVAHDVAEGYVSEARARQVYGVALDGDGAVDEDATNAIRSELLT
jgi:N-methylhydantoinase B